MYCPDEHLSVADIVEATQVYAAFGAIALAPAPSATTAVVTSAAPSFESLLDRPGLAWMGQNTTHLEPPPEVVAALPESTRRREFQLYAPGPRLRGAARADRRRPRPGRGGAVMITDGAVGGLHHVCTALAAGLSRLITTDPGWPWQARFVGFAGVPVTAVPVYSPEQGYRLSADQLAEVIEPRSLIYLIDPLNPLGSSYGRDELAAIVDLARASDAMIVHDCTYRHFAAGHTLVAELYPEGTFTTYSFSKWLGLAGLRVGAVVGRPGLMERLTEVRPTRSAPASRPSGRRSPAWRSRGPGSAGCGPSTRANQQVVSDAVDRSGLGRVPGRAFAGQLRRRRHRRSGWTAERCARRCSTRTCSSGRARTSRRSSASASSRSAPRCRPTGRSGSRPPGPRWAPAGPGFREGRGAYRDIGLSARSTGRPPRWSWAPGRRRGAVPGRSWPSCALDLAAAAEPVINAYARAVRPGRAGEAAELEAEARAGRLRSGLHGVPVAVKDNMYLIRRADQQGLADQPDERASRPRRWWPGWSMRARW